MFTFIETISDRRFGSPGCRLAVTAPPPPPLPPSTGIAAAPPPRRRPAGTLDDPEGTTGTMTMVAAWALFAAGMYMMRPNTLRANANQNGGNLEKPAAGARP